MFANTASRAGLLLMPCLLLSSNAVDGEIRPQFKRGKEIVLKQSLEVTTKGKIEAPDQSHLCEVNMEMEYDQSGNTASVTTFASVPDCDKASGPYQVRLSYRDAAGAKQRAKYAEEWSSSNNGMATRKYTLDTDAELTRVSLTGMRCFCHDTENPEEVAPQAPANR